MSEQSVLRFLEAYDCKEEEHLRDFFRFLEFASISAQENSRQEVLNACQWYEQYVGSAGLKVQRWETSGYPVIFAEYDGAGPSAPTIMFYGHYDVQPVDPLELWKSDPFCPEVRDGQVYARGAQDNKGQCFFFTSAVCQMLKEEGRLPVNVKLLVEGEEEVGSTGLTGILQQHTEQLKSDYLVIVDVGVESLAKPTVTLGVRGIVTMTVTFRGSERDLHSGAFGGMAYNPNHALVSVLASLRNPDGSVAIDGFYDGVPDADQFDEQILSLKTMPDNFESLLGFAPEGGEVSFSPKESAWIRPTLEVNGIAGGYSGDGFKTVIPATAKAKVSCRLVGEQDPHRVGELVKQAIISRTPKGVSAEVFVHSGVGCAVQADADSAIVHAARCAFSEVLGVPCGLSMEGGSIPVVAKLANVSGAETTLLGLGLPTDCLHAPNEHFGIDRLRYGYALISRILELMGDGVSSS